jgi:hypothetical protein
VDSLAVLPLLTIALILTTGLILLSGFHMSGGTMIKCGCAIPGIRPDLSRIGLHMGHLRGIGASSLQVRMGKREECLREGIESAKSFMQVEAQ